MDKYHIGPEIGKGKNSIVYKGRMKKKIKYVAIKSVVKTKMEKTLHEVMIMYKLDHPNLLKFFSWYETSKHLWLILEYCTGGSLYELLRQDERLPESAVRTFGADLVSGLHYLHSQGILYCDLKPSNILFNEYGVLKLSDFALAKRIVDDDGKPIHDERGARRGTPCYMSPELFATGGVRSYASEHWALGCLLYELRFGTPPFVSTTFKTVVTLIQFFPLTMPPDQATSDTLTSLIRSLLRKDPARRIKWPEILMHEFWESIPMPDTSTVLPHNSAYAEYLKTRVYIPSCREEDDEDLGNLEPTGYPASDQPYWKQQGSYNYQQQPTQVQQEGLHYHEELSMANRRENGIPAQSSMMSSQVNGVESKLNYAATTQQAVGSSMVSVPPAGSPPAILSPRAGLRVSEAILMNQTRNPNDLHSSGSVQHSGGSGSRQQHDGASDSSLSAKQDIQSVTSMHETDTGRSLPVRQDTLRLSRIVQRNLRLSASVGYDPAGARLSGSYVEDEKGFSGTGFEHGPEGEDDTDIVIPDPDIELNFEEPVGEVSEMPEALEMGTSEGGGEGQSVGVERVQSAPLQPNAPPHRPPDSTKSPRSLLLSKRTQQQYVHTSPEANAEYMAIPEQLNRSQLEDVREEEEWHVNQIPEHSGNQGHAHGSVPPPPPPPLEISMHQSQSQATTDPVRVMADGTKPSERPQHHSNLTVDTSSQQSNEKQGIGPQLADSSASTSRQMYGGHLARGGLELKNSEGFKMALQRSEKLTPSNGVRGSPSRRESDISADSIDQRESSFHVAVAEDIQRLLPSESDIVIKPIIGNPSIMPLPHLEYEANQLPFVPVDPGTIESMSIVELEQFFSKLYISLHRAAGFSSPCKSEPQLVLDILGYLCTLCDTRDLANVLINSSLVTLLIRTSVATQDAKSPMSPNALNIQIRYQVVVILAILIRHAVEISPGIGEMDIFPALIRFAQDQDIPTQRFSAAGLGELVFYISTITSQSTRSPSSAQTVKGSSSARQNSSRKWKRIPTAVIKQLYRNLSSDDTIVRLCAAKTFENVFSRTQSTGFDYLQTQPGGRLATEDTLRMLSHGLSIALENDLQSLASSLSTALSHLLRIDWYFVERLVHVKDVDAWLLLRTCLTYGVCRVQQSGLNILNMLLLRILHFATENKNPAASFRFFSYLEENEKYKFLELQEVILANLTSTQTIAIRAKSFLCICILLRLDEAGALPIPMQSNLIFQVEKYISRHSSYMEDREQTGKQETARSRSGSRSSVRTRTFDDPESGYLTDCIAQVVKEISHIVDSSGRSLLLKCMEFHDVLHEYGCEGIVDNLDWSVLDKTTTTLIQAMSSVVWREHCAKSLTIIQAISNLVRLCDQLTIEVHGHSNLQQEMAEGVSHFVLRIENDLLPLCDNRSYELLRLFTMQQEVFSDRSIAPIVVRELLPAVLVRCITPSPEVRESHFRIAVSLIFALIDYGCCFSHPEDASGRLTADQEPELNILGKQISALVQESITRNLNSFLTDMAPIPQFTLRLLQKLFDDIPSFSNDCGSDDQVMATLLGFLHAPVDSSSSMVLWVAGLVCQLLRNPAVFRLRVHEAADGAVVSGARNVFRLTSGILVRVGLVLLPGGGPLPVRHDVQFAHLGDALGWVVGLAKVLTCWHACPPHPALHPPSCSRAADPRGLRAAPAPPGRPGAALLQEDDSLVAVLVLCVANARLGSDRLVSPQEVGLAPRSLVEDWEVSCLAAEVLVHLCRELGAQAVLGNAREYRFPVPAGLVSLGEVARWPALMVAVLREDPGSAPEVPVARLQLPVALVLQGAVRDGLLGEEELQDVLASVLHLQRLTEDAELLEALGDLREMLAAYRLV